MRRRILVADDSSTIQKVIKIALSRYPIDMLEAASYIEALSAIGRTRPDALILDASLPGAQGPKDFAKLAADAGSIPVLLLVGTYETIDEAQFRASGLNYFLRKPFDAADLVKQVEQILGQTLGGEPKAPISSPTPVSAPSVAIKAPAATVPPMRDFAGQKPDPVHKVPPPPPQLDIASAQEAPLPYSVPPPPPGRGLRSSPPSGAPIGLSLGDTFEVGRSTEIKAERLYISSDAQNISDLLDNSDQSDFGIAPPQIAATPEPSRSASLHGARIDNFDGDADSYLLDEASDRAIPFSAGESQPAAPANVMIDERRRGRRAFAAGSRPLVAEANSPVDLEFEPPENLSLNLGSNANVPDVSSSSLQAQLPALVREAVEAYCERHFKSLAREIIAAELRRLADEKARQLVDP